MSIEIGKIVKSNSHIDYVCHVNGPGEAELLPTPADYAFGTMVLISLSAQDWNNSTESGDALVGVIYNTQLLNPDFGGMGPRLSPQPELEIFSPDYLSETATLVGILTLGWRGSNGVLHQGVPILSAMVNGSVYTMTPEEVEDFHQDLDGKLHLKYIPVLLSQNNPLIDQLIISLMQKLVSQFPACQQQLDLIRNNLAWKNIVQPVR
ncbi:hypothetical protein KFU94_37375 [Chloroflexi bacterium TSY]|nr:hypothetical protein [Chloroflexi bacterium TSY]